MNEEKYGWLIALSVPFNIALGLFIVVALPVWIIGYVMSLITGSEPPVW